MADDVFKLPQSSYDTIARILQAYSEIGEKTNLGQVAKMIGNDETIVSRNVAFLMALNLLEGGRDKGPTILGAQLGRALQFQESADISRLWLEALQPNIFVQRVLSAVRVRGGMEPSALQGQIVYTAGVSKNAGTNRGAGTLIEILKLSGLLAEREDKLIARTVQDSVSPSAEQNRDSPTTVVNVAAPTNAFDQPESRPGVNIELRIVVQAQPSDLADLGAQLRKLIEDVRGTESAVGNDELDES